MKDASTRRDRDPGQEWMLAFQRGDDAAFDRIVGHYHEAVRNFAGRYLTDSHRAEDIAQEAFIRVFRARKRYEPSAKFLTWIFTIVTRLCLNEIRSVKRRRTAISIRRRPAADGELDDLVDSVPDSRAEDPRDALERAETEMILQDTIDGLPDNQRVAILLLRFHDAHYQEIATVLGISAKAVKSLVNRARGTLRGRLERYRADPGQTQSGQCHSAKRQPGSQDQPTGSCDNYAVSRDQKERRRDDEPPPC